RCLPGIIADRRQRIIEPQNGSAQYIKRISLCYRPIGADFQRGLTVVGHDDRLARGFDLPEKFKRPSLELGFRHLLVVHDALSKWSLRVVILAENDYIK